MRWDMIKKSGRVIAILILMLSVSSLSFAQTRGGQGGGQGGGGQGGGGATGGGRTGGNQPTIGTQPTQPQPNQPDIPRQIYLSGSVRLGDGTTPPTSVVIERVCGGIVRPEAYTDSRGNF